MARGFVVLTNQLGFGADFLGLCYGVLSFVAARKLHVLRKSSRGWNTTNFFAASLLFGSVVRLLSFATASALNYLEISLGMSTSGAPVTTGVGQPSDYVFYSKALEILVDFPHFITLSTYMLLALVWAEAILMVRARRGATRDAPLTRQPAARRAAATSCPPSPCAAGG